MHRPSGFARFHSSSPGGDPAEWTLTLGTIGARRLAGIVSGMKLGDLPWEGATANSWMDLVSDAIETGQEMRIVRAPVSPDSWHALEMRSPGAGCLDLFFHHAGDQGISVQGGSTEQSQLVESLRFRDRLLTQEKERLAVTLRSIGDGVVTTDRDGLVTMLNKVAEDLTGWVRADAIGQKLSKVFVILDESTRESREDRVAKVFETRGIVQLPSQTSLVAKDGRELPISDSAAPILDDSGAILGVVLVFRDMTERQRLAEAMHRVQSMDSIGVLAGGIAHDFNNLLTGIFGNVYLARKFAAEGNLLETQELLSHAMEVFDRAKALTQQLLTFSKGGTPVRSIQEIGALVRNSVQFALSGSNVSVAFGIPDDIWLCDCDGNQIGQVIDNLVLNAVQANPGGGEIEVWVGNRTLEEDAKGSPSHNGNFVEIVIHDNGAGMSPEVLSKIFTPFFSTKPTGHGLGLAAVYSIVQRHDGWVEVESEPGAGTTFHVFLPADPHGVAQTSSVDSSSVEPLRGTGRILVMDDQKYIANFMSDMLEYLGYSPTTAKDGKEAVLAFKRAEESGDPFRACILDLTIPGGMGGIQTALAIQAIRPGTIVVASSGYTDNPVVLEPKGHGFSASLMKPFRMEDLANVLKNVLT
jgi:PAS domain S-box-containing protein